MRTFLLGSLAAVAFLIGAACIATDVWIASNLLGRGPRPAGCGGGASTSSPEDSVRGVMDALVGGAG